MFGLTQREKIEHIPMLKREISELKRRLNELDIRISSRDYSEIKNIKGER